MAHLQVAQKGNTVTNWATAPAIGGPKRKLCGAVTGRFELQLPVLLATRTELTFVAFGSRAKVQANVRRQDSLERDEDHVVGVALDAGEGWQSPGLGQRQKPVLTRGTLASMG